MTTIVKMIMELGSEALCEGVETKEQLEFLKEIGCTKVQGFYFSRAQSVEDILKRYETGTAIGLENPLETDYYSAVSMFNVNDPSVVSSSDPDAFMNYKDSIPVVVLELNETTATMIHSNVSGERFIRQFQPDYSSGKAVLLLEDRADFVEALLSCGEGDSWKRITDILNDGTAIHAFARLLAVNPVTGAKAVAVINLAIVGQD